MTQEEEVVQLRTELAEVRALIAKLQAELEHLRASPLPRIKPNTPKPEEKAEGEKKPRRKRAKDQNGVRRREQIPTQTVHHTAEKCPDCGYRLSQSQLAGRRQVIELPPPQPVEVTEHQVLSRWARSVHKTPVWFVP